MSGASRRLMEACLPSGAIFDDVGLGWGIRVGNEKKGLSS